MSEAEKQRQRKQEYSDSLRKRNEEAKAKAKRRPVTGDERAKAAGRIQQRFRQRRTARAASTAAVGGGRRRPQTAAAASPTRSSAARRDHYTPMSSTPAHAALPGGAAAQPPHAATGSHRAAPTHPYGTAPTELEHALLVAFERLGTRAHALHSLARRSILTVARRRGLRTWRSLRAGEAQAQLSLQKDAKAKSDKELHAAHAQIGSLNRQVKELRAERETHEAAMAQMTAAKRSLQGQLAGRGGGGGAAKGGDVGGKGYTEQIRKRLGLVQKAKDEEIKAMQAKLDKAHEVTETETRARMKAERAAADATRRLAEASAALDMERRHSSAIATERERLQRNVQELVFHQREQAIVLEAEQQMRHALEEGRGIETQPASRLAPPANLPNSAARAASGLSTSASRALRTPADSISLSASMPARATGLGTGARGTGARGSSQRPSTAATPHTSKAASPSRPPASARVGASGVGSTRRWNGSEASAAKPAAARPSTAPVAKEDKAAASIQQTFRRRRSIIHPPPQVPPAPRGPDAAERASAAVAARTTAAALPPPPSPTRAAAPPRTSLGSSILAKAATWEGGVPASPTRAGQARDVRKSWDAGLEEKHLAERMRSMAATLAQEIDSAESVKKLRASFPPASDDAYPRVPGLSSAYPSAYATATPSALSAGGAVGSAVPQAPGSAVPGSALTTAAASSTKPKPKTAGERALAAALSGAYNIPGVGAVL